MTSRVQREMEIFNILKIAFTQNDTAKVFETIDSVLASGETNPQRVSDIISVIINFDDSILKDIKHNLLEHLITALTMSKSLNAIADLKQEPKKNEAAYAFFEKSLEDIREYKKNLANKEVPLHDTEELEQDFKPKF